MKKKSKIVVIIIAVIIIGFVFTSLFGSQKELVSISSKKQLKRIYNSDGKYENLILPILTLPFSFIVYHPTTFSSPVYSYDYLDSSSKEIAFNSPQDSITADTSGSSSTSKKDYSTTNIQVENVDEADITKTDGDYIYSLSGNKVVITDVRNPEDVKIATKINPKGNDIPEDLLLYNNKLVVISSHSENNSSRRSYYYSSSYDTSVRIYNIDDKTKPNLEKEFVLDEPYYTSRAIDNNLFIISSGYLRTVDDDDDEIATTYEEDGLSKEIPLKDIKYLKDVKSSCQTLISHVDLNNIKKDISVKSYLIDVTNAYVSTNAIYLLDQDYDYSSGLKYKDLFTFRGIFGIPYALDNNDYDYGYKTKIFKFDIEKNGDLTYNNKAKVEGRTINQYSMDEYDNNLRVALYNDEGSRIVVLNDNLKQIGESTSVAKGERMYASRFMGEKAYLVTYQNTDPLFVIDLKDPTAPKVLGELQIPGYSTYLHPYDENHLIGIGMETEEVINRNSYGQVTSSYAVTIGMKMALFDVSDVNDPIQLSETIIGDRRTTSAILSNPKALLFSKERNLIAIPVNNYSEDFSVNSSDSTSDSIYNYTNYYKDRVGEGYFVYNINLKDGFSLRGIINHEEENKKETSYYYYSRSRLLRGLYIDNNLFTVSENELQVHDLETLEPITSMKILNN